MPDQDEEFFMDDSERFVPISEVRIEVMLEPNVEQIYVNFNLEGVSGNE